MDDKFRSILTLALRPETGEGESAAALAAARRMVAKNGLDKVMGAAAAPKIQERVVTQYQDRVVYRDVPRGDYKSQFKIRISSTFMLSMIERLFDDAAILGVSVRLISCQHQSKSIDSGAKIEIEVAGTRSRVEAYEQQIDKNIAFANKKRSNSGSAQYLDAAEAKRTVFGFFWENKFWLLFAAWVLLLLR